MDSLVGARLHITALRHVGAFATRRRLGLQGLDVKLTLLDLVLKSAKREQDPQLAGHTARAERGRQQDACV